MQKVKGKQVAKVAIVLADAKIVIVVLPASYRIDFAKLGSVLWSHETRLAKEDEFSSLFSDCDTGAMSPFGNMYGVPVYVDRSLAEDLEIVFQAGSHQDTMKIAYKDYVRLAEPKVADFAVHQ